MFDINDSNALLKEVPAATTQAGGWWESTNSGLSNALDLWGKVEVIKGVKSANGSDQQQAMYQPELKNGAAIQVDKQLTIGGKSGIKIDKPLLYGALGLLGLAFVLRMKGF